MILITIIKFITIMIFINFIFLLSTSACQAINMRSQDYYLQMGDLNMLSGRGTSPGFQMTQTGGDLGPGLYTDNANFKVRSGFQYVMAFIPFRFSVNPLEIDFGTLSANTLATGSGTLTIDNGSATGYQVTAYENHRLAVHGTGGFIPDFTGDDGTCTTPASACTWLSDTTYGLGYNMSGTDTNGLGFTNSTYYKQFSDDSASESPEVVMTGTAAGRNKQAVVKYTVNISSTQAAGSYENVIVYTATPSY